VVDFIDGQYRGLSGEDTTLKRELDGLITQMHSAGVSYTEAVRQFKRRYIIEVLSHHKVRNGMRRPPMSERPRPLAAVSNLSKVR